MKVRRPRASTRLSALWVIRRKTTTCLYETPRRAEATVFRTRPSLKEENVDLSFYEHSNPVFTG